MEKLVSLKNINFAYEENLILKNINLEINNGDYLGIIGPNGSGKSTLIKLMLNFLKPLSGKIELFGQDIEQFRDWGKIGYVAQRSTYFNTAFPATVEEVVAANLSSQIGLFKSIKKEHLNRVKQVLEFVGMVDKKKKLIGNLSGGQQQKVFIARALVSRPRIIFLDEPTMGIDLDSQREFYNLLGKLNKELKITIVMVSHDVGVVTEKATRLVCVGNRTLLVHNNNCNIPINEVLKNFYGDKMKILIHYH